MSNIGGNVVKSTQREYVRRNVKNERTDYVDCVGILSTRDTNKEIIGLDISVNE